MSFSNRALAVLSASLFILSTLLFVSAARSQDVIDQNEQQEVAAISQPLFNYQGRLLDKNGTPVTSSGLPMIFEIFPQASGGSSCWKEAHSSGNAVQVQDGVFQVILGQITAISISCATGEAYLQLTVNGEAMSPRERLTSVTTAVQAMTLPNDVEAFGDILLDGDLKASAGNTHLNLRNDAGHVRASAGGSIQLFIDANNDQTNATLGIFTNQSYTGSDAKPLLSLSELGDANVAGNITQGGYNFNIRGTDHGHVALRGVDSERTLHLLPWGGADYNWDKVCIGCGSSAGLRINGPARIDGDLDLHGTCSTAAFESNSSITADTDCTGGNITTAAVIEANLQTPTELNSERIERFSRGDLLCWEPELQKLELCVSENDRLVMAVADDRGKPIVMGAEPVKVVGPITAGDILVSATEPGHATANNNPAPGTVIGQALEDFDGESGLIKAMIRKW